MQPIFVIVPPFFCLLLIEPSLTARRKGKKIMKKREIVSKTKITEIRKPIHKLIV
jgi:hypothetical protein